MGESSIGVSRRLARLRRDGSYLFLAADHGLSVGPSPGLATPPEVARTVASTARANATGVVVHYGMARYITGLALPLVLQTMGAPQLYGRIRRRVVATARQAVAVGADAIAIQIDFRDSALSESLEEAASVTRDAHELGLPVLTMVSGDSWEGVDEYLAAIRWATELGADLVKIAPGGLAAGPMIDVRATAIPILLAGGPPIDTAEDLMTWAGRSGYAGFCLGRNVFEAQDPEQRFARLAEAYRAARA